MIVMQVPYIRVIYAKGKIFLIGALAILIIITACYQLATYFFQAEKIKQTSPQNKTLPTPLVKPFSREEEEKKIAEVQALPIEEVKRQLKEKAPGELQALIGQGVVSDETLRELLIIISNY
ncbi:MAG: hypothetical protein FJ044_02590 [Candidatus Cloacimonetes bacterium]|nr:hypothetical protein [Candidatus Cloacimonadota bacterium]